MSPPAPVAPLEPRPKAARLARPFPLGFAYDQAALEVLSELLDFGPATSDPSATTAHERDVEIIISGWGMPRVDDLFLQRFPNLRVIFHAAGSIRGFMTEVAWARGLRVTTAASVNARPVAEFVFAQIILSLKCAFAQSRACHASRHFARQSERIPGAYGSTVGLLSLGEIGRQVAQRLAQLDVAILAYDPFVTPAQAQPLGVELVALEEVFARANVVSCHTPLLPATVHLVRGRHVEAMPPHATLINTARGGVVHHDELIAALQRRPDLTALLDVTDPEPPAPDSRLFTLPNVFLTPHISGSMDHECFRLGRFVVEEVKRYLQQQPLAGEVTRDRAELLA